MNDFNQNNSPLNKDKNPKSILNTDAEKLFKSMEEYNRYNPEDLVNTNNDNSIYKKPTDLVQNNLYQLKNKPNEEVSNDILSPQNKDADAAPTVVFSRGDFANSNRSSVDSKSTILEETANINKSRRRRRGNYSQEVPTAFQYNSKSESNVNYRNNNTQDIDLINNTFERNDEDSSNSRIQISSVERFKTPKRKNKFLILLLIFILMIVVFASLFKFIDFDKDSIFSKLKNKFESILPGSNEVKIENFSANTSTSAVVGDMLTLSLTSSKNVKNIRLVDVDNNVLDTVVNSTENNDVIIWTIDYKPNNNYKGIIWPQLLNKYGEWIDMKQNALSINIENPSEEAINTNNSNNTLASDDKINGVSDEDENNNDYLGRTPVPTEAPTSTPIPTVHVTATPTAEPTIEPTEEPTPEPTQAPTVTPRPTASPVPVSEAKPANSKSSDAMKLISTVYSGKKKVANFTRISEINMPDNNYYRLWKDGIFTFRGGPYRQNASEGAPKDGINENVLKVAWSYKVGGMQTRDKSLYGFGYMSQPSIIKWYKEARDFMNFHADKKDIKGLTEIIYASQDGKIYFLDLADGQATREPINTGFPMNSAVSVYPSSIPIFSVGQSVSFLKNKQIDGGYRIFSLLDQKQIYLINGRDKNAYFSNSTFDGTSLFDRFSDSMVVAGENGFLYTVMLNSEFKHSVPSLKISPTIDKIKSIQKGQAKKSVGIESSVSMLGKYAYIADSSGLVQCIDTSTMSVAWSTKLEDNIDTTIAIEAIDETNAYIYLGTTLQNRNKGNSVELYKINAYTGETVWRNEYKAQFDKKTVVGALASPLVGNGVLDDLVVFTVSDTKSTSYTAALKKSDGTEVWRKQLSGYSVSSPIAVYDYDNSFIIQGDSNGNLYLLDAKTGDELNVINLEGAIESSPAAYNGNIVVGTSGGQDKSKIYCITIN